MRGFWRGRQEPGPEPEEVPGWAQSLSEEQFTALMGGVQDYFDGEGIEHVVGDGIVLLGPEHQNQRLGLTNLAQLFRATPEGERGG